MGAFEYYIQIRTDKITAEHMVSEYEKNSLCQRLFSLKSETDSCDGYNVQLKAVIDNFMPANHLIYNFLSNYQSSGLHIRTNNIEQPYDFVKRADFIKFMYDTWQEKISCAYAQFGVMTINNRKYYKVRNRMYYKYYVKIPMRK